MYSKASYKHNYGQTITTDAEGVEVKRAFLAHINIPEAAAADAAGILPLTNLAAEAQEVTEGLENPAVPRNVQIDGNVLGITGDVTVTGTNYNGDAIEETFAANGTTNVVGNKAFKTITKVELPVQVHTPAKQVETATAAGTVTTAGNAAVTITSALLEDPEAVAVPVELNDDAAAIAAAIRTALAANANISAHFDVSGEAAAIILTAKEFAANDDTLNIAIADGDGEGASVGVTTAASSTATTPGVAADQISVGWGDKFGLPYRLPYNTVLKTYFNKTAESVAPTVAADADDLENNTILLNSTPDGEKDIDIYLIV